MKKYATVSLFVFWALLVAVFVAGLASYGRPDEASVGIAGAPLSGTPDKITGVDASVATLNLSLAELAKHNSSSSCWLLISGKIYDVTSSISSHPGGTGAILRDCGTNATIAFDTKGGQGSSHSNRAASELAQYYIGDLDQTINLKPSASGQTTPYSQVNSVTARSSGSSAQSTVNSNERESEDDD